MWRATLALESWKLSDVQKDTRCPHIPGRGIWGYRFKSEVPSLRHDCEHSSMSEVVCKHSKKSHSHTTLHHIGYQDKVHQTRIISMNGSGGDSCQAYM